MWDMEYIRVLGYKFQVWYKLSQVCRLGVDFR